MQGTQSQKEGEAGRLGNSPAGWHRELLQGPLQTDLRVSHHRADVPAGKAHHPGVLQLHPNHRLCAVHLRARM